MVKWGKVDIHSPPSGHAFLLVCFSVCVSVLIGLSSIHSNIKHFIFTHNQFLVTQIMALQLLQPYSINDTNIGNDTTIITIKQ